MSKQPDTDRSTGGPGSSHQSGQHTPDRGHHPPAPGEPTSGPQSKVSGGGGEKDSHHTHDPRTKG